MKRSSAEKILLNDLKRRQTIFVYSLILIVLFIITIFLFQFYLSKSKKHYVNYKENSNIDYKVYLKDNDFFETKYLGKESDYIASLIDYIEADFIYNVSLEDQSFSLNYSKRIEAEVIIKDVKGEKPLFRKKEVLLDESFGELKDNSKVNINEIVKIDYNHFNQIVSEFKKIYKLENADAMLKVSMHIDIDSYCDRFDANQDNSSEISLNIPLTTKTMSVEIDSDLIETGNKNIICESKESFLIFLILAILLFILDIFYIIFLSLYIIKTRTALDIYKKELKKILSNYHSFIQKINNSFDLSGYQLLNVETFNDMLEIRDTLQQPILMIESKEKDGVYFIIPSNTKILYLYSLKVEKIKEQNNL